MEFVKTFLVMEAVSLLPIVLYALRKARSKFNLAVWAVTNSHRLGLGAIACFLVSLVFHFVPEAGDALGLLGFDVSNSSAAVGIAIGSLLVTSVNSKKI